MEDKVQKIKNFVQNLKEENSIGLCEYDAGYCNGVGETCDRILTFIDSYGTVPEPKFKEGDIIRSKKNKECQIRITGLGSHWYLFERNEFGFSGLKYEHQDDWELVEIDKN